MKKHLLLSLLLWSSVMFSQQLSTSFETYPPAGWSESHTGADLLNQTSSQTHTGTFSANFQFGNNSGVDTSRLITPVINGLAAGSELRFWQFCQFVSGGSNFYSYHGVWISVNSAPAIELINLGAGPEATWNERAIDLSAYSGANIQLMFVYKGKVTGLQNAWYIDDVTVNALLTCPPPTAIIDSAITQTSAKLSWNNGANDSSWIIEYGPVGFTPGTGTFVNVASHPYTLNSLTPATSYDWYVRSLCTITDSSSIEGPGIFTTLCPFEPTPYTQDFISYQPICWTGDKGLIANPTVFLQLPNSAWYGDDYLNNPSNGQSAAFNLFGYLQGEWLFSPAIDLSFGNPMNIVEFDLGIKGFNSTFGGLFDNDDTLALVISTDGGFSWNKSNILEVWDVNNQPDSMGEHVIIDLSSYLGVIKLGFYAVSQNATNNSDVFIDNFRVGINNTTSLSNLEKDNIRVYPNPANGSFSLDLSRLAGNSNVKVVNSSGQIVHHVSLKNSLQKIDLSELANGLYNVVILNNGKTYNKTVSIVR